MNADTFDRGSDSCPVCHRTGGLPSVKSVGGLLTCPHCRSRLVVSLSGHYVRDPFRTKKLSSQQLRKQSRPIARILRDSGIAKHSPLIAIVGSLLVVSFSMAVLSRVERLPDWADQIILKDAETKD
ncbi:hypothetical protein LEP3755_06300 [Leptolyngbya sp. NIES-3755]|nr:hypothetical protein LEP3755_06300 [Leptolyngbya sp. NIES-3755]